VTGVGAGTAVEPTARSHGVNHHTVSRYLHALGAKTYSSPAWGTDKGWRLYHIWTSIRAGCKQPEGQGVPGPRRQGDHGLARLGQVPALLRVGDAKGIPPGPAARPHRWPPRVRSQELSLELAAPRARAASQSRCWSQCPRIRRGEDRRGMGTGPPVQGLQADAARAPARGSRRRFTRRFATRCAARPFSVSLCAAFRMGVASRRRASSSGRSRRRRSSASRGRTGRAPLCLVLARDLIREPRKTGRVVRQG
jgi:hypothetical protein